MKLLHLDSSVLGGYSATRELSGAVVKAWQAKNPSGSVVYHDLAREPLAHFSDAVLGARTRTDVALTANGPVGLAGGKKVIVVSARGGFYNENSPGAGFDFQEKYLRAVFNFLGVTDIEFVRAEGLAIGPEQRSKALESAHNTIKSELLAA
jgi:FMN-dependent NADH-azoreductase